MLQYTLLSIRQQLEQPHLVRVNISRCPYLFDAGIDSVPAWLASSECELRFVENTGPYRKLLPTLEDALDSDIIVTFDDDVLYGPEWLRQILESARAHPDTIVCSRARRIPQLLGVADLGYAAWGRVRRRTRGLRIVPIGCGGVAYRKRLLDSDMIRDKSFMDIAPTADDLWFRAASWRMGVEVLVEPSIDSGNRYVLQPESLTSDNIGLDRRVPPLVDLFARRALAVLGVAKGRNDHAWRAIKARWPIPRTLEARQVHES